MVEDKLLIWRCKRGSRAAFQRIYEKYESDLRTLAANLLYDKAAVEDVVHDVFVSLLQVVDKFELRSSLAGYLKTCVANRSRDYMRKRKLQTATVNEAEQVMSSNDGPVHLVIKSEELKKLGSAMSQIPYEQREAIILRLHGQMKFRIIAELQNVTTKTAHSRYRTGIEGLRLILNSEV
ncbi:MAG: sigma-70 family RNA polymerase sigma factor [Planctomycetes bacterium]|nr:sigma-70 family RNA polymerase sigma factor [Planctomycetota bacterium]